MNDYLVQALLACLNRTEEALAYAASGRPVANLQEIREINEAVRKNALVSLPT